MGLRGNGSTGNPEREFNKLNKNIAMIRKPNKRILKTLAQKIEQAMTEDNCKEAIKNCRTFIAIVDAYEKNKKSLNNERI